MRPLGVSAIAVIQVIRGVLGTLFGLAIMAFGGLTSKLASLAAEGNAIQRMLSGFGSLVGVCVLVFAALCVVAGYGLFKMQNWARLLTLLLSAVALVVLLPILLFSHGLPLVMGVINAAMIFYLVLPPVKRAFKAGTALATAA